MLPTVLLVGAEDHFGRAVAAALARHGVHLEQASADSAVPAAVVTAPDLIVLVATTSNDEGKTLLAALQARPETGVIPVALIHEDAALDTRLRAFRYGAAALLPKKASADELARRIAELAREIPERPEAAMGELGEVTLEELVRTLGAELRSGILSVEDPKGEGSVRLVLGGGKPLAALIADFVERAREHVRSAEPLRYEFDARAGGTVQLLEGNTDEPSSAASLTGLRVVLADDDPGRAEAIAHELRRCGAEVLVTDLEPSDVRLSRIRAADPAVLLIGEEQLQGSGYALVRRMRKDTRLRWTSLLLAQWSELWREDAAAVDLLSTALARLTAPERQLTSHADSVEHFDARLETLGPARTLRALAGSSHGLRVTVANPRLQVELDLANGLLVGALARKLDGDTAGGGDAAGGGDTVIEGVQAVAGLLQLGSGRVQVDRVPYPARANVMASLDMALGIADGEAPPIRPSLPASAVPAEPAEPAASAEPAVPFPVEPAAPSLPSIPVRPWSPEGSGAHTLAPEALLSQNSQGPGTASAASPYSLSTSASESAAPPPQQLRPSHSAPPPSAPPSLVLSPIDLRLREFLQVDENGPSPSLVAIVGCLLLLQLFWIGLLVASSIPSPSSPLVPVRGTEAPLAERGSNAPAPSEPPQPNLQGARPGASSAEAAETPAPVELPLRDGSSHRAPTCESLLNDPSLREGHYPGLANDEARKGMAALTRAKFGDALNHYCRAVRWDENNPLLWSSLAQVYMLQRDAEGAAAAAEKGVALAPDDTKALVVLADAAAHLGDAERARDLWKRAAKLTVADAEAHAALVKRDLPEARRAERSGNLPFAERMYRRVALLAPEQPVGAAGLARVLLALEEVEAARSWAEYAVHVGPDDADAHVARGDVLHEAGDTEGARQAWQRALELDGRHPVAKRRLR